MKCFAGEGVYVALMDALVLARGIVEDVSKVNEGGDLGGELDEAVRGWVWGGNVGEGGEGCEVDGELMEAWMFTRGFGVGFWEGRRLCMLSFVCRWVCIRWLWRGFIRGFGGSG